MDKIKELEKYKKLLDLGAINEGEFRQIKQKILGLKTDEEKEAEKKKIEEEERTERENKRRIEEQRVAAEKQKEEYEKRLQEEKIKERARREVELQEKVERKKEKEENAKRMVNNTARIIWEIFLWIVFIFFAICSLGLFLGLTEKDVAFNLISAFVFLLFSVLACPALSKKLKKNAKINALWKYKKIVIIGVVVLWIVLSAIML